MATGIVEFFNDAKGFGFIMPTDGTKKIFAHGNDMKKPVRKGDKVSYTVEEGARGPRAVDITIV